MQRHEGFGPVALHDPGERPGNGIERLVPRNTLKLALALGAGSPERMQNSIRRIGARLVIADLGAKYAPRERVVFGARDAFHAPVRDVGYPGTGILAIKRTTTSNFPRGHRGILPRLKICHLTAVQATRVG